LGLRKAPAVHLLLFCQQILTISIIHNDISEGL
jgi:hypothetical protein